LSEGKEKKPVTELRTGKPQSYGSTEEDKTHEGRNGANSSIFKKKKGGAWD